MIEVYYAQLWLLSFVLLHAMVENERNQCLIYFNFQVSSIISYLSIYTLK